MSQMGIALNQPSTPLSFSLETLPEAWSSQQAEMRVAWERLAEMAPSRPDYWQNQLQACLASQRASLVEAYVQSWQTQVQDLLKLGLQEQLFNTLAGTQAALADLQVVQAALLQLKLNFESLYLGLSGPEASGPSQIVKKFWQNQARFSDSLKMNNETAFKMALQAELNWRTELMLTPGLTWVETLSLTQLSQICCDTLGYYFLLRGLLTQRQRRLESGQTGLTDLKDLRKAHRALSEPTSQFALSPPEHAWKLSLTPKGEGYEIHNQWGLALSQLNRSYLDYLKTGFYWLEQCAEQQFSQPNQLLQAAESFYKALSVNAYSYEAHWALACICFLMGLSEQALAFLEKAVQQTRDPGLRGLQEVLDLHAQ